MDMAIVLYVIIFFLRLLVVWQFGEAVNNINTPNLKAMAWVGFTVYIVYLTYITITGIPTTPDSAARLIALLMITTALNKELKKRK